MGNPLLVNTLSSPVCRTATDMSPARSYPSRWTCWTLIDRRTRPYRMRRVRETGWYFQLNVTRRRISLRGRDERQRRGIMILARKQMKFRSLARGMRTSHFSVNQRGSAFSCTIESINATRYSQRNTALYTIYRLLPSFCKIKVFSICAIFTSRKTIFFFLKYYREI